MRDSTFLSDFTQTPLHLTKIRNKPWKCPWHQERFAFRTWSLEHLPFSERLPHPNLPGHAFSTYQCACPSLPAPSSRPLMPQHPTRPCTREASALTIIPVLFPYLSFYGEYKDQTVFLHSCSTSYLSFSFFPSPPTQFYLQISFSIASFCQCFIISFIHFSAILVFFFFTILFLSIHTQCGAWSYNPKVK